jgi:hypothetical protein
MVTNSHHFTRDAWLTRTGAQRPKRRCFFASMMSNLPTGLPLRRGGIGDPALQRTAGGDSTQVSAESD